MIIEPNKTTAAYRCPSCGSGIMSAVNVFDLSADRVKLKCDCKTSEMDIIALPDGRVQITVPCIFCRKNHTFTVNKSIFFGQDIFAFACPYSNINIAFVGDMNHVKAELARSELELLDMLEENGVESFDVFGDKDIDELPDPEVLSIVTYVVSELSEDGRIYCNCPEGEGEYEVDITSEGICIECKRCGAKHTVAANSLIAAHDFLNSDSLTLK